MFDTSFKFIHLGNFESNDSNIEKIIKFRFKTHKNNTYIVDVEKYKENVYIIKYYLKNHSLSENKYSLRTNENIAHKIFGTCLEIAQYLLEKDKKASFGYIGVNDITESKVNTKRYRIYKKISESFFNPDNFVHYQNDKNSLYLILNKYNKNINEEYIIKAISENFDVIL